MKITGLMLGLFILGGLSFSGCGNSGDSGNAQQQGTFTTLQKGAVSPFGSSPVQISVIRNELNWATFWSTLYSNYSEKPPLPSVNFSDTAVIALVDTPRPTGGHSITINTIQPASSGVTVHSSVVSPGPNCVVTLALTQPFHLVTVPTFSGEATLEVSQSVENCGP